MFGTGVEGAVALREATSKVRDGGEKAPLGSALWPWPGEFQDNYTDSSSIDDADCFCALMMLVMHVVAFGGNGC